MVTLYSTHCPKCRVLEAKLQKAGIDFRVCEDIPAMEAKGISSVPVLEMEDGALLDFAQAASWVNHQ